MTTYLVAYAPLSDLDAWVADGWRCANGRKRPEPMIGIHGRWSALLRKDIETPSRSMPMGDSRLESLDPATVRDIPADLANLIKGAEEEAGPGATAARSMTGIAMASLVTYVLQHGDQIVALVNLGVQLYQDLAAKKQGAAPQG